MTRTRWLPVAPGIVPGVVGDECVGHVVGDLDERNPHAAGDHQAVVGPLARIASSMAALGRNSSR
jgi:hypothetical protein